MSNLTSTIQGNYPLHTFEMLQSLWQQMAVKIGLDAQLTTEAQLKQVVESAPRFSLLSSYRFQALLTGSQILLPSKDLQGIAAETPQIEIEIKFGSAEIKQFLQPFVPYLPSSQDFSFDERCSNDSGLQSYFTQLLLTAVARDRSGDSESYLQQQLTAARLLNEIATQIHQTPDLGNLIQSVIERVRAFLAVDRLIIYQFESVKSLGAVNGSDSTAFMGQGKVSYEALSGVNFRSVLDLNEAQDCFTDKALWERYRAGITKSIDLVDREYAQQPCMLALMKRNQIKSQLIVPIVIGKASPSVAAKPHSTEDRELWGLAIAHQCQSAHCWQADETEFLQQVAAQLAVAIHQAQLAAANQSHTQNLERLVNERTQELRDAVIVAQTANQSKTEFLALLSHELRTPLTSILGLSATLLRLPSLNLTDRQQSYIQTIHNSGDHLSELIDDILDFYKLEVGKTFLKVSEFSLSRLIKQIVEIVRPKAELGKINLQVQIVNGGRDVTHISGRDLRFRGDNKRIRQILVNILSNAIKFTPEHGTVIVRSWLEDSYAVFEVEDSGIGIDPEQIPRLFKKFHQLNPNYDRDYAGMGLGLAITQQLVELHGGRIDVDSSVGSGSTFTVRLAPQPLQLPDQTDWDEMDRQLVFQDPELNPIANRIMLIEPDENLANFICDILTAARYQVTWLLSVESSFSQISVLQPDLLIIDLEVGEPTADRTIRSIRKSKKIADTKILAIATKEQILSSAVKECVDDYLWKQINPEQLLRKVIKLLSQKVVDASTNI